MYHKRQCDMKTSYSPKRECPLPDVIGRSSCENSQNLVLWVQRNALFFL